MNNRTIIAALAAALLMLASLSATAAERMLAGQEEGPELMMSGVADVLTWPAKIAEEVGEDTSNFGVGGIVTGTVAGGVKAAGQVARGGGRTLIGFMDWLTKPLRESSYHRSSPGSMR